jgi:hypothetical protein
MNTTGSISTESNTASTKLVSLLALAAGAAAMPQTSNADIIFQSANAHVGFGAGDSSSFFLSLPGTTFGFGATGSNKTRSFGLYQTLYRTLQVGHAGGAAASVQGSGGLVAVRGYGQAWNNGFGLYAGISVAKGVIHKDISSFVTGYSHAPAGSGYDHQYYAFRFTNGVVPLYGWVEVGLNVGGGNGPSLTVYGYAYDNTGAQIAMGAVPEPDSTALLALGALTLGAKGLRHWRRNRTAPPSHS